MVKRREVSLMLKDVAKLLALAADAWEAVSNQPNPMSAAAILRAHASTVRNAAQAALLLDNAVSNETQAWQKLNTRREEMGRYCTSEDTKVENEAAVLASFKKQGLRRAFANALILGGQAMLAALEQYEASVFQDSEAIWLTTEALACAWLVVGK